jgi:hypothetical protein
MKNPNILKVKIIKSIAIIKYKIKSSLLMISLSLSILLIPKINKLIYLKDISKIKIISKMKMKKVYQVIQNFSKMF